MKILGGIIVAWICSVAGATSNLNYDIGPEVDDGIDYDRLKIAVQDDQSIRSLEQTLALVPKPFFDKYVLLYRSRSLQGSSYLKPRAVVFGRSARFVFAFNGDEKHDGYNTLEIIQFRQATNRFEFHEITFESGKLPRFSDPNPKKCLECHQSPLRQNVDMRPNWEPYNFWPGVYASVDETIEPVLKIGYENYKSGRSQYLPAPLNVFQAQDLVLIDEQSKEKLYLNEFETKIKPSHPRYRFLPDYNLRNPLSLTKILITLNFRRIWRLIKEELGDVDYAIYKPAVAGLSSSGDQNFDGTDHRCGKLYLPDSVKEKMHVTWNKLFPDKSYTEPQSLYAGPGRFPLAVGLEWLFETRGIDTSDWSLDFKTGGRFSFDGDRFTSPNDSAIHLRDALNLADPELGKLSCDKLKELSLKNFTALESSGELDKRLHATLYEPKLPQTPLINRCIRCHVGNDDLSAPRIPFDNFTELAKRLPEPKYLQGSLLAEIRFRTSDHAPRDMQMPPAGRLDSKLRDEFIQTLEGLVAPPSLEIKKSFGAIKL